MAGFGANYPNFAPFSGNEPANALPKYGTRTVLGKLVTSNLTVNLASGELFADDAQAEQRSEFASGSIAMEVDDMVDNVHAAVFGATLDEQSGELKDNAKDSAPLGGLTYYKRLQRNGVLCFKGYFYPKVRASLGNDNAQTKGSSITFNTTPITFTVLAPNVGDWRITKEFDTEAAARAWVEEKLTTTTGA